MKVRYVLWIALLVTAVSAQAAERTTACDTRVPAVANAAAFTVW